MYQVLALDFRARILTALADFGAVSLNSQPHYAAPRYLGPIPVWAETLGPFSKRCLWVVSPPAEPGEQMGTNHPFSSPRAVQCGADRVGLGRREAQLAQSPLG